jgi:alkyl hydroperoxide reductase subunit AhpC
MTVNDLPVGRSVDETLRLIKAFQFAVCSLYARSVFHTLYKMQDKYGEVCPANWTEGSKTIKADPKASLEYFSATGDEVSDGLTNGSTKKRARVD